MTGVCFVDTETTGLDPDRHSIWEVALITPNGDEHVWQFPIVELEADPFALEIGHYWERHWDSDLLGSAPSVWNATYDAHKPSSRRERFPDEGRAIKPGESWARYFRDLTAGLHLAGAVVSFDEERLRKLLRSFGVMPRWHYHLIDVEALAVGWLSGLHAADAPGSEDVTAVPLPWKSTELSERLGVDPEDFERHTALGDARWAKAIYEAVMGTKGASE